MSEFFDLTTRSDIDALSIQIDGSGFNCHLTDGEVNYDGFILAKSSSGRNQTICEIDFHRSGFGKHQPRLVFRRTKQSEEGGFEDVAIRGNQDFRRIPFQT